MPNVLPTGDLLEDDFREPYTAWKTTPGPASNAAMLKVLDPVIHGAIRTHVGAPHPLIVGRARRMTLDGLKTYDPKRGRLSSHLYGHLQGLKRENRKQQTILKVPERVVLDQYHLATQTEELAHELGREPTDDELADRTGFSPRRMARVRSYDPGMAEGTAEGLLEHQQLGVRPAGAQQGNPWHDIVYDELDGYHRKIFELAFGLNGRRPLQNQEIAAMMGRSPGAISQAKGRIQAMLDQEHELSPFGG